MTAVAITHRKVASLLPEWNVFRGASLLMHPFGFDAERAELECTVELFKTLGSVVDDDRLPFLCRVGYCPLPPATYHATWADLIHDGNIRKLSRTASASFGDDGRVALGREYPTRLAEVVARSGVLDLTDAVFDFELTTLNIRNGSALTVEMSPRPGGPQDALEAARARLALGLASAFGLILDPFRPHVTLGYFANKTLASAAQLKVEEIAAEFKAGMGGKIARFSGPTPFTFSDMINFVSVQSRG